MPKKSHRSAAQLRLSELHASTKSLMAAADTPFKISIGDFGKIPHLISGVPVLDYFKVDASAETPRFAFLDDSKEFAPNNVWWKAPDPSPALPEAPHAPDASLEASGAATPATVLPVAPRVATFYRAFRERAAGSGFPFRISVHDFSILPHIDHGSKLPLREGVRRFQGGRFPVVSMVRPTRGFTASNLVWSW